MGLAVAVCGCYRLRFGLHFRFGFTGFAFELIGCLVFRQIKSIGDFLLPLDKSSKFFGVLERLFGLLSQASDALLGGLDILGERRRHFVQILNRVLKGANHAKGGVRQTQSMNLRAFEN